MVRGRRAAIASGLLAVVLACSGGGDASDSDSDSDSDSSSGGVASSGGATDSSDPTDGGSESDATAGGGEWSDCVDFAELAAMPEFGTGGASDTTIKVSTRQDMARYWLLEELTGALRVERRLSDDPADEVTCMVLPHLRRAGSGVVITGATSVERLVLPALEETGELDISGRGVELEAPALAVLTGNLRIAAGALDGDGEGMRQLELPALGRIDGGVVAGHRTGFESLRLPALASAQSLYLVAMPQLERVEIPALIETTYVEVGHLEGLQHLDLGALERASSVAIQGTALAELTLPALQDLTEAGIDGPLRVVDNAGLPTCEVQAIVDQLSVNAGWSGDACAQGNLADACADWAASLDC